MESIARKTAGADDEDREEWRSGVQWTTWPGPVFSPYPSGAFAVGKDGEQVRCVATGGALYRLALTTSLLTRYAPCGMVFAMIASSHPPAAARSGWDGGTGGFWRRMSGGSWGGGVALRSGGAVIGAAERRRVDGEIMKIWPRSQQRSNTCAEPRNAGAIRRHAQSLRRGSTRVKNPQREIRTASKKPATQLLCGVPRSVSASHDVRAACVGHRTQQRRADLPVLADMTRVMADRGLPGNVETTVAAIVVRGRGFRNAYEDGLTQALEETPRC